MVADDRYSVFFRLVILASAAVAVLLGHHYLRRSHEERGEFYALLLFATSGMTLLTAATDLIVVFTALEVLSLSLYVMAGFSWRRLASQEASLKYFLLGAFSSHSSSTGSPWPTAPAGPRTWRGSPGPDGEQRGARPGSGGRRAADGGLRLQGGGGPVHMWTPDVYEGAPTPVTAFMAAGTKVAGFRRAHPRGGVALGGVGWGLARAGGLAAVTMVVGSFLAIAQRNVKRMLACSSIAHAGFVLVGVAAGNQEGISGAMFYLVACGHDRGRLRRGGPGVADGGASDHAGVVS